MVCDSMSVQVTEQHAVEIATLQQEIVDLESKLDAKCHQVRTVQLTNTGTQTPCIVTMHVRAPS